MKMSKTILFFAALLFIAVLAVCKYFTDFSTTTITMIYVAGQGFLLALYVPYLKKSKTCKTRETR